MEMNMAKFSEKLAELIELAKKTKNVLEYQEINDFFKDFPLDAEHMDKVFDYLEANGVDVLRIQDNDMDDLIMSDEEEMNLSEEDEVDMENIDLSVPEGVSIEDPVRMYLKEIGKVHFSPPRKRSAWQKEWKTEMKAPKSVWQKPISVW